MTETLASVLDSNSESYEMTRDIIDACSDAKGSDLTLLHVSDTFDLADYFIIASGRSDRQVLGICNKIQSKLEEQGIKPYSVEGLEDGHWVLMDYGDVIVHLFYEPVRAHYDIEGLWINAKRADVDLSIDLNEQLEAA